LTAREFSDRLSRRARRVGIVLPAELVDRLRLYYELLAKWNDKINLTGLNLSERSPEAIDRLLIEPLLAARYAGRATSIIDIGSGGGSPAIPFALAIPGAALTMVEAKTRKSVFLREAARALEMDMVVVLTARHEALLARPELHEAFDVLTIRAVRVEIRTLATLQAFVKPKGRILHFCAQGDEVTAAVAPPLVLAGTYPLVEWLRSRLAVYEKSRALK